MILILSVSLLAMNGCKSAPPQTAPVEAENLNVPDWISLPPPEDELWGIGAAFAAKDYEAMLVAETRAKASIVQRLRLYLDGAFDGYNRRADAENRAVDALIEDAAFKLDNMLLKEAVVDKRQQTPNKTWWYRVSYKKADARTAVFQILDSEIEQYPEFNPNRAIVFFDEQSAKNDAPIVTSE
ncbi:MAG: hypothetical protein LBE74_08975 [Treponema sp.]|jgi:hypothetical protein|nr:hypothetical protein [Treponema sp.]